MTLRADQQLSLFLENDTIDGDFFSEIVEKSLKISREKFHLRLVALTPATGKNENFTSFVLRAAVKVQVFESKEKRSINVIIKALLDDSDENVKDLGLFQRERYVYGTIIDRFESIWQQHIGEKIQFAPACWKVTQTPYETIILEDLRSRNYFVVDRKSGLDLKQSEIVLKKLARFHATGAIYLLEVLRKLIAEVFSGPLVDEVTNRISLRLSFQFILRTQSVQT